MEILIGGRGTGKTRSLIELAYENKGILAVGTERERAHIWEKSRALGMPIEVVIYEDIQNLKGTQRKIYIDEIEGYINFLNPYVAGFSVTKEKK